MTDTIYKVRDPTGVIREIKGPEGATDDEILHQAQSLFAQQQKPSQGWDIALGVLKHGPLGILSGTTPPLEAYNGAAYNAGGRVTDFAAQHGAPPSVAGGLGYATNVGMQSLPMLLGGEIGKGAAPAAEGAAKSLMQSAIKPTTRDLETGKAARAVATLLKENKSPNQAGVAALRKEAGQLGAQAEDILRTRPETVRPGNIASRLQTAIHNAELQVNPAADVHAIEGALQEFLASPRIAGNRDIPVYLANQIKSGTYKSIGDKAYGEVGSASETAQKILAAAIREDVGAAVPETAPLMARQSELLNAANVAQRRALLEGNKNPIGLAPLTHEPINFLTFLADRSARLKALAARILYQGKEQIPATAGRVAGANAGMVSGQEER